MKSVVLNIFFLALVVGREEDHWEYPRNPFEPDDWAKDFKLCGSDEQSPVDIVINETVYLASLLPIEITKNKQAQLQDLEYQLFNSGYTLGIEIPRDTWYASIGRNTERNCEIFQINFRWGSNASQGSEHLLDGKSFPMETHIYCYVRNRYDVLEEALMKPNGLAVLSIWNVIDNDADEEKTQLGQVQDLTQSLGEITEPRKRIPIPAFDLDKLFEDVNLARYYQYFGSLTVPPCTENVFWFIFENPVPVKEKQIELLRQLRGFDGEPIQDNFRAVKPLNLPESLNPRKIYRSFRIDSLFGPL